MIVFKRVICENIETLGKKNEFRFFFLRFQKKGQFTRHFFRKGLAVMANIKKAEQVFKDLNLTQIQIQVY